MPSFKSSSTQIPSCRVADSFVKEGRQHRISIVGGHIIGQIRLPHPTPPTPHTGVSRTLWPLEKSKREQLTARRGTQTPPPLANLSERQYANQQVGGVRRGASNFLVLFFFVPKIFTFSMFYSFFR